MPLPREERGTHRDSTQYEQYTLSLGPSSDAFLYSPDDHQHGDERHQGAAKVELGSRAMLDFGQDDRSQNEQGDHHGDRGQECGAPPEGPISSPPMIGPNAPPADSAASQTQTSGNG